MKILEFHLKYVLQPEGNKNVEQPSQKSSMYAQLI